LAKGKQRQRQKRKSETVLNDKDRPVAVLPQEQKSQASLIETVGQTNANAHASDNCTSYVMAHSTNMSHDDAAKEVATVCNK
jgi:hypothetical protein